MRLETERFGVLELNENSIITLTQPILGFQQYRRFVLLPGPSESLHWLQSTDSGKLAFILLNPQVVMPDYRVDIHPRDLTELAAEKREDLQVYTLVVVPEDPSKVRTNLKAPILLNPHQRLAKQIVLDKSDYPVQFFLSQTKQRTESSSAQDEEVSNARFDA
jgi:flagellar assembly factor FliW